MVLIILLSGCKEEYNPNIVPSDTNILVVEGYISTNGQKSTITLSKTNSLEQTAFPFESGARLILTGEHSGSWYFGEESPGNYVLTANLPLDQKYRLSISLKNNENYISDLMQPLVSPAIDDLKFEKKESGVSIQVDLQGNENSPYFLWRYEEDWTFRSAIGTSYIYNRSTKSMEEVVPETDISRCWNNNKVQRISIDNSLRFNNYLIKGKEITTIPNNSEKLSIRYSILVKQFAIDKDAFDFWEIMRKNTEDIGGIFSPLPSLISSNISKINSQNERAIGYISMGELAEKRIYINNEDISPWPVYIPEYKGCIAIPDTIRPIRYDEVFAQGNFIPVDPIYSETGYFPIAFRAAPAFCVDCRLRGTKVKPEFWENQ